MQIAYSVSKASEVQIAEHLRRCSEDFVPALGSRVVIDDYARKLAVASTRFEAWESAQLVGLVAAYCNDKEVRPAFVTNVSVLREWSRKGIARTLLQQCVGFLEGKGCREVCLEVSRESHAAIKLYLEEGFVGGDAKAPLIIMRLALPRGVARNDG